MSRRPTKQLTMTFVLRTLARVQMMTRLNQKLLAKALLPHRHRHDVQYLSEYLGDVASCMGKVERRRHPACVECGDENMRDHHGARYCSNKCRQRAYRKRNGVTLHSSGSENET
jgi:hypothetical protein